MTLFHIKMTLMYWMSWFITKTIYFSKDTTLVEVNDDERMKTNTYILLSLTYERCTGLCHEDYLKMKIIGVSCILCVHIHRDTSPFMMMSTDEYAMMMMIMPCMKLNCLLTSERRYGQLAQLCWVQGMGTAWGSTLAFMGCVGKYFIVRTGGHYYESFKW